MCLYRDFKGDSVTPCSQFCVMYKGVCTYICIRLYIHICVHIYIYIHLFTYACIHGSEKGLDALVRGWRPVPLNSITLVQDRLDVILIRSLLPKASIMAPLRAVWLNGFGRSWSAGCYLDMPPQTNVPCTANAATCCKYPSRGVGRVMQFAWRD